MPLNTTSELRRFTRFPGMEYRQSQMTEKYQGPVEGGMMDFYDAITRIEATPSVSVRYGDSGVQDFELEEFLAGLVQEKAVVSDVEAKREFLSWFDEDDEWLDPDWDAPMVEQTVRDLHVFAGLEPKVEIHIRCPQHKTSNFSPRTRR